MTIDARNVVQVKLWFKGQPEAKHCTEVTDYKETPESIIFDLEDGAWTMVIPKSELRMYGVSCIEAREEEGK